MQLDIHTTITKPSKTNKPLLEAVGIQEHKVEDVASFTFTDNGIKITFNNEPDAFIPLRGMDGENNDDWRAVSIFVTRKFLKIDMSS